MTQTPIPSDTPTPADVNAKAVERMDYIKEELQRKLESATRNCNDLATLLKAADVTKIAELAADNVEKLVKFTVQARVYGRYAKAIAKREADGEAPAMTFQQLSMHAFREVSVGAAHQPRGSSWQSNVTNEAELAAAGEVAALFVEITRV